MDDAAVENEITFIKAEIAQTEKMLRIIRSAKEMSWRPANRKTARLPAFRGNRALVVANVNQPPANRAQFNLRIKG